LDSTKFTRLVVVPKTPRSKGFQFLKQPEEDRQKISDTVFYLKAESVWYSLLNIFQLVRQSRNYDIVHFEFSGFYLLFALFLPKKCKVSYSIRGSDIQGNPSENLIKKTLKKMCFFLFGHCVDIFFSVSENLKNQLPWFLKKRCLVLPTPLDSRFHASFTHEVHRKNLRIGVVCGHPHGSKNESSCLAAIAQVSKRYNIEIEPVLLDGSIAKENMPKTLADMNVLISGSVSEGSPNIIREALAAGTPVVCHDCGDTLERFGYFSGLTIVPVGPDFLANGIVNSIVPRFSHRDDFLLPFSENAFMNARNNAYEGLMENRHE
jgi:hypothetical protein